MHNASLRTVKSPFVSLRRLPARILGALVALCIVLAVRFFERRFRLDARRPPAWRSRQSL